MRCKLIDREDPGLAELGQHLQFVGHRLRLRVRSAAAAADGARGLRARRRPLRRLRSAVHGRARDGRLGMIGVRRWLAPTLCRLGALMPGFAFRAFPLLAAERRGPGGGDARAYLGERPFPRVSVRAA